MVKPVGTKDFKPEDIDKNRDVVERLAAIGTTDDELGFVLGMSEKSVKNHYRFELDRGRANLRTALRKAQFEAAVNDKNPTMLIWLGKNYLKQKDCRHDVKHSGDVTFQKVLYDAGALEDSKNPLLLS